MSPPSKRQLEIRSAFKSCADCFGAQPMTGGEEPSGQGPYSREWWYTTASPTGLWYYDYFMQQSMDKYLDHILPDWCIHSGLTPSKICGRSYDSWGQCDQQEGKHSTVYQHAISCYTVEPYINKVIGVQGFMQKWTDPPQCHLVANVWKTELQFLTPADDEYNTIIEMSLSGHQNDPPRNWNIVAKRVNIWGGDTAGWMCQSGTIVGMANTSSIFYRGATPYIQLFIPKGTLPKGEYINILLTPSELMQSNFIPPIIVDSNKFHNWYLGVGPVIYFTY